MKVNILFLCDLSVLCYINYNTCTGTAGTSLIIRFMKFQIPSQIIPFQYFCHISVIQKSIMLQVDSLCVVEPVTISSSTFFLMWNQNVWLNCKAELVFLFCILHFVSFTEQMLLCSGFSLSKSQGTLKTMMTVIFSTFQSMSGAILKRGREGGSSVK